MARIDITTQSDPGPRFLDPKTGHVYDELGNVWPQCFPYYPRLSCRIDTHDLRPAAAPSPTLWESVKAFIKENW